MPELSAELPAAGAAELRRVACEAAMAAGAAALPFYERHDLDWERKAGPRDLVSKADRAAEGAALEIILAARPRDAVWGEEGGYAQGSGLEAEGLRWGVDGVDGTTNFLAELPHWCASVGLEDERGSLAGAVYHPASGELFSAVRGHGTTLDGLPLKRRPPVGTLAEAVCAVGLSYEWHEGKGRIECLERLVPAVAHVRQMGSMALDLGWAAAGRFDLYYYESGLHPHDIAQRAIAEEAGLRTLLLEDSPVGPKALLLAPEHLLEPFLKVLGR